MQRVRGGIDRIVMTLAENLEVLNLRAAAGECDLQERRQVHSVWFRQLTKSRRR